MVIHSPQSSARQPTTDAIEAGATEIAWMSIGPSGSSPTSCKYKLCVIDNGCGMNGEEMLRYINHLSASIHEQAIDKNFGVGVTIPNATMLSHGTKVPAITRDEMLTTNKKLALYQPVGNRLGWLWNQEFTTRT